MRTPGETDGPAAPAPTRGPRGSLPPEARLGLPLPLRLASQLFNGIAGRWHRSATQRGVATGLVLAFLATILVIEASRLGLLPDRLSSWVGVNHYGAIGLAFTLLLVLEVLGMVFILAESVASSVGKQFELLSLIFLRKAFLTFQGFGEPIDWESAAESVPHLLADIGAALLIFVVVGFYYRVQRHRPITTDEHEQNSFVAAKEAVALLLLLAFAALGIVWSALYVRDGEAFAFFEAFFTILIFSDVLIVLISLRYSTSFSVVFRNSGFATTTVLARLSLTAPTFIGAALGVGAALIALALSLAYNAFAPVMVRRSAADSEP
jgi:hypothetical protein